LTDAVVKCVDHTVESVGEHPERVAEAERARQQSQVRQHAANIRELRNAERQAKADVKEAARLYLEARVEEAEDLTREIQVREAAIDTAFTGAAQERRLSDFRFPQDSDQRAHKAAALLRGLSTPPTPGSQIIVVGEAHEPNR
jgi:hypothetical protein